MQTPTEEQILHLLDNLHKGDHLALCWASDTNGCVAYLRVSSKRQLDGAGLRDQWRACVQHAQRLDLPLVGLYVDPAISGRKELRPALDQLKRDVQRRRFGTVIFYKVNRIGRNARASYQTAEEVERAGAIVASATETFNRRTAAGNLTFGMLVAVAQFGSDQLGEVMTDTLRAKAERGEWVGPVPLGYTRAGKTLVPSPDAEAIKLIGQLYCSGTHTHASIADALDAAGWQAMDWRTGERRRFGRESIRVILHNAAYIGKVSCGDQLYDGQHPPLWDQAAWDTIQRLHRERSEKVGRTSVKLPKRQLLLIEIAPLCDLRQTDVGTRQRLPLLRARPAHLARRRWSRRRSWTPRRSHCWKP